MRSVRTVFPFIPLAFLFLAAVACNYPGVVPTPTPAATLVQSVPPTLDTAATLEATPTLVTVATVPPTLAARRLPTSTPIKLAAGVGVQPVNPGVASGQGLPPNASNGSAGSGAHVPGSFQVKTASVAGGTLLLPDDNTAVPLDYDANNKGQRAVINADGSMFLNGAPFTANGKHAGKRFVQARWSPNGQWLAYIVMTPDADKGQLGWQATIDDGLWLIDTSVANATPNFIMRNYYDEPYDKPLRLAYDINWGSDNDAMLITVKQKTRIGTVLVGKGIHANDVAQGLFDVLNYVGSSWAIDAQSFIAGTPAGGDPARIITVGRDVGKTQVLADGSAFHLWMQTPVMAPDGRVLFLGKPSDSGKLEGAATGLSMYAMWPSQPPAQVTQPLNGEVLWAAWNPAHSGLLVTLRTDSGIQVKIVTMDGSVLDYTTAAHGATSVHWAR
jgi:hypothetical protein